jgi:transposase-like protein
MKASSRDWRIRALAALDHGAARAEVIRLFGVSTATLTRWRRRQRETGSLAEWPRPGPPGVKPAGVAAALEPRLQEPPDATLEAHCGYRPADSPDLTPIEAACSKVNAALRTRGPRTVEAQSTAVWAARRTITPQDAAGWIAHAGDGPRRRPTRSTRRRPTPIPASRVPDAPPVITLQVPTPILFDHLW